MDFSCCTIVHSNYSGISFWGGGLTQCVTFPFREGGEKSPNKPFADLINILGERKKTPPNKMIAPISVKPQIGFVPLPSSHQSTGLPLRCPGRVLFVKGESSSQPCPARGYPALNGPQKNGRGGPRPHGMGASAWCKCPRLVASRAFQTTAE